MPTIRLRELHGEIPKLDRRKLPGGAAQKAKNVRFDSGDLRPIREPLNEQALVAGDIGNLFWYRHQDDSSGMWISFGSDLVVHGFRSMEPNDDFRRWYWNISGESMRFIANPKNPTPSGASASVGTQKEFRQFEGVRVGIPAPQTAPVVIDATPEQAVGDQTGVAILSIARTNPITINTNSSHGFQAGQTVRFVVDPSYPKPQDQDGDGDGLPGDPGTPASAEGQVWALEGEQGVVSGVSDTQFSVTGVSGTNFLEFIQADIDALRVERVIQDSELESRVYIWTYVSQYDEEGPPSEPSNVLDVPKDGAYVEMELSDLLHQPTIHGGDRNYINRIRVYRSVSGQSTIYRQVGELQFSGAALPDDRIDVQSLAYNSGTIAIFLETTATAEYAVGDAIFLRSKSDESFQYSGQITDIADSGLPDSVFLTDIPESEINVLSAPSDLYVSKGLGIIEQDSLSWIAPPSDVPTLAWTGNLVENVRSQALGRVNSTQGAYPPPNRMQGLAQFANGVLAGWRSNSVYFSHQYLPYSWDPDNFVTVGDEIVGGETYGNTLVLGTKSRPYIIPGTDPASMVPKKLPLEAPMLYKRGICDAGFGVLYISRDGLVAVTANGARYVTEGHYTEHEWLEVITGRDRVAYYDGMAMIYGPDKDPVILDLQGDMLEVSTVELDIAASATQDGELAVVAKGPGSEYRQIQLFKRGAGVMTGQWQTGIVSFRRPVNPAVAQVFADDYPITLTLRHIRPGSYPEPVEGQPDLAVLAENTFLVEGPEPFWLPGGFLTREFEIEIETEHRVQEILVSTSMDELRQS